MKTFLYIFLPLVLLFPCKSEALRPKTVGPKEISLKEANAIRESLSPKIALSASQAHCLMDASTHPLLEVLARFRNLEGGVWCKGAADILTKKYLSLGIPAVTLSYGLPREALLTHAVTIVKTKEGWFIQDPYFNLYYIDPLPLVIDKLRKGDIPRFVSNPCYRIVHFENLEHYYAQVRYISEFSSPEVTQINDNHVCVRLSLDVHLFNLYWYKMKETMDSLSAKGHPRDVSFLMLYPYDLYDISNSIGFSVSSCEEVFERLAKIGRHFGAN